MKEQKDLFEQFRQNKNLFDKRPKALLWNKLDEKLDHHKNVKKLRFYRVFAFAAMILVIVAAVGYFNHYLNDHNPELFVSNEGFSSLVLEDLSNDDNSFFNTASITTLQNAYAKFGSSDESLNISGQYISINKVDKINIFISNLNYQIQIGENESSSHLEFNREENSYNFNSNTGTQVKFAIKNEKLTIIHHSSDSKWIGMEFNKFSEI